MRVRYAEYFAGTDGKRNLKRVWLGGRYPAMLIGVVGEWSGFENDAFLG